MGNETSKCPCCGATIMVGQEVCLNCLVYLWESVPSPEKPEEVER